MPVGTKPRLFDQCGPFNPLLSEYDLDVEAPLVRLEPPIFHQEMKGQFAFPEGSAFRFVTNDSDASSTESGRGEFVQIAIRPSTIRTALERGENPIRLSETLTLFRGVQPARTEIHARVNVFRSGPQRPLVNIKSVQSIDIGGEIPADGHVVIGHVLFDADRMATVECRGQAQFTATATVTLGSSHLAVGFRRHHRGSDERDRGWLMAETTVIDWLEFDAADARFTVRQLDLGISYQDLRQLLRDLGERVRGAPSLTVSVRVDMVSQDNVTSLQETSYAVRVVGSPAETISFSGLCGSPPRRLALTGEHAHPPAYEFPRIRVRHERGRNSRPAIEPVEFTVTSDSEHVAVEIAAILKSPRRDWLIFRDSITLWPGERTKTFYLPLEAPLTEALTGIVPEENLTVEIVAQVRNRSDGPDGVTDTFKFHSQVEIEGDPPNWLCCVDFGTSSTAVWIVNTAPLSQGYQLELGDWLARIDPLHPESTIWLNSKDVPRLSGSRGGQVSYLLPSNIGLASELSLRADFDPLSMGDLRRTLPGVEGAELRLAALDRTYDVSMPFPSTAQTADYAGTIITEPKKRMIMRAEHVALGVAVPERDASGHVSMVRRVDLAKLVEDCFDELGGYTAQSVLSTEAANAQDSIAGEIERARLDPNSRFGLIVSHPSGIDEARRDIYKKAGERFLRAFCGEKAKARDVTLAAEALAAARFGIEEFLTRTKQSASTAQNFVTLDIGAGTYDVTVIRYESREADRGRVLNHFGLAIGGNDLDRILMKCIYSILLEAASSRSVLELFHIDPVLFDDGGDSIQPREQPARQRLKLELQGAKARLTRMLLDQTRETYRWPTKGQGGPPLDIKVGQDTPGAPTDTASSDWAIRPRRSNEVACEILPGAELRFERDPGDVPSVRLRLWRDVFDDPQIAGNDELRILHNVMGEQLPHMALGEVASSQGPPTAVIVTGRAALWPLLHETIEATVAKTQGLRTAMARNKPFTPETMKQAVVRGAVGMAPEWRDADATIENPIAIVTFKVDVDSAGGTGPSRAIDTVTLLVDDRLEGERDIVTNGPFVIARIIPGLDRKEGLEERLRLFRELYQTCRIKPFAELTRELSYRGEVHWRVKWQRDASGLLLTFFRGQERIIDFGPFGGGRVFGPQ